MSGRAEVLRRGGTYPGEGWQRYPGTKTFKRYRWTGEKRPPRKGERYLSGSQITAYIAHGDLGYPYHIAEEAPISEVPCPTCGRGSGR